MDNTILINLKEAFSQWMNMKDADRLKSQIKLKNHIKNFSTEERKEIIKQMSELMLEAQNKSDWMKDLIKSLSTK